MSRIWLNPVNKNSWKEAMSAETDWLALQECVRTRDGAGPEA